MTPSVLDLAPDDHALFFDTLLVAAAALVVVSKSQEPFPSSRVSGVGYAVWDVGGSVSLMHALVTMGRDCTEGRSGVPGGGSGTHACEVGS